ncbi:hypothetical protein H0H81_010626 [Sphagnurus paluster]|uniref:HPP transmembrane region domain-containing protein n=1 Tax=Sphagnurus paluster TaxID=117069 RepID=A0A9P7GHV6_9AGAR|nr:hypothetical protein H0H81_010626 [Sphagnurus paluster]
MIWLWSFLGAFCGISVIQAVFGCTQYFISRHAGGSAVLIYGAAVDAPLAQPRAVLGGHFISALTGICITKLFLLLPSEQKFPDLVWLAASLACATSMVLMQMTSTTHPPAGATALVAATSAEIRKLGWYYLPVILLTSTLALAVALLLNNIQRQYPAFWFRPDAADAPGLQVGGLQPKTGREDHSPEATIVGHSVDDLAEHMCLDNANALKV